jgi:hypothetical protein
MEILCLQKYYTPKAFFCQGYFGKVSQMEIFHMEETKGKIFKKKIEISFVDEESCSGLELIPILNAIKPGGNDDEPKGI